jgi:hypothetical protein
MIALAGQSPVYSLKSHSEKKVFQSSFCELLSDTPGREAQNWWKATLLNQDLRKIYHLHLPGPDSPRRLSLQVSKRSNDGHLLVQL